LHAAQGATVFKAPLRPRRRHWTGFSVGAVEADATAAAAAMPVASVSRLIFLPISSSLSLVEV
jgi:hypothetical protein